jgi:glycosyltransferase involved in cell wall biosynthesis
MKPRVLLLSSYYHPVVGGAESNARRLATHLAHDGFDVTVLTKRITRDLPGKTVLDGVPVERIGPFGQRSAAGKWWLVPAAVSALVARRAAYDVVCCADVRGAGVAAIAARTITGRPVVVQAQTPGVMAGDSPFLKAPVRAIYKRADAFACISHSVEHEALNAGVSRDRVHYLPNAIDMKVYRPGDESTRMSLRRELNIPNGMTVCLFVGRLSREKGVMELVEAWQRLPLDRRASAVLLIGGPDMEGHPWDVGAMARAFVAEQHLGSSVRFLGGVSDVPRLLKVADVFVQPSHFEALGLSAIEALASGIPVIASAVGGLLDFIVNDHNGTLCPPGDPAALASALTTLLADEALRRHLAANARASVVDEYDERIVFGRFAALLCRLTGAAA